MLKNGIVTLAGHVDSYSEKWNAERAALRVAGITSLAVDIEVKLSGSSKRTDADIARSIENVMSWLSSVPKGQVKVMVENGWVTLSGQVEWRFQPDSAAAIVLNLLGVTGVSNDISIKPKVSSAAVKAEIEAALTRHARADAEKYRFRLRALR